MGDIADMVVEGILCEQCGGFIDESGPGHPRLCAGCKLTEEEEVQDLNAAISEFKGKVTMVVLDDELALSVHNDEDRLLFIFRTVGKMVVEIETYQ